MHPLIAVTGRHLDPGRVSGWSSGALAVPRPYTDALRRAGGQPVVVPPGPVSDAADVLRSFAGLVLTGGADVDPALYGAEAHDRTYGVDPELDQFEMALARAAVETRRPVLAICRGLQVLNVALGGTLQQHVADEPGRLEHHQPGIGAGGGTDHEVRVLPGTRLAEALGAERTSVRSNHHQAVERLADGAVACAWADDELLEGFELDSGWVVAVQWHPETTAAADSVQQNLFDRFVKESS